jgi:hypothetical protein
MLSGHPDYLNAGLGEDCDLSKSNIRKTIIEKPVSELPSIILLTRMFTNGYEMRKEEYVLFIEPVSVYRLRTVLYRLCTNQKQLKTIKDS